MEILNREPDVSVQIGPLVLPNRWRASGTFGYGQEYQELLDIHRLGALYTGRRLGAKAGTSPASWKLPAGS